MREKNIASQFQKTDTALQDEISLFSIQFHFPKNETSLKFSQEIAELY